MNILNNKLTAEDVKEVYELLRDRVINPCGEFDNAGRWFSKNESLLNVRQPSRAWPYSQMKACRTLKYVKAVVAKLGIESKDELMKAV